MINEAAKDGQIKSETYSKYGLCNCMHLINQALAKAAFKYQKERWVLHRVFVLSKVCRL